MDTYTIDGVSYKFDSFMLIPVFKRITQDKKFVIAESGIKEVSFRLDEFENVTCVSYTYNNELVKQRYIPLLTWSDFNMIMFWLRY